MLRENDLLVIKSIDRLGRNYEMIVNEWKDITKNIKMIFKVAKEKDSIAKALKSLNKTSFSSEESALSELNMIKKKWKLSTVHIT